MRRWLSLLLLFILPLQFTLAAAAAYCQHEQGPDVRHFGHHVHVHQADAGAQKTAKSAKDNGKTTPPTTADYDCGICHLGTVQPVSVEFTLRTVLASPDVPQSRVHRLGTRDPDRLERPNWRAA